MECFDFTTESKDGTITACMHNTREDYTVNCSTHILELPWGLYCTWTIALYRFNLHYPIRQEKAGQILNGGITPFKTASFWKEHGLSA